jgi:hypothetical protein
MFYDRDWSILDYQFLVFGYYLVLVLYLASLVLVIINVNG